MGAKLQPVCAQAERQLSSTVHLRTTLCSRTNGGKRHYNLLFASRLSTFRVFLPNNQVRFRMKTFRIFWVSVLGRSTNKRRSRMWNLVFKNMDWNRFTKWTSNFLLNTQTCHISGGTVPTPSPSRELHKLVLTTGRLCVNHKMSLFQNNQSSNTTDKEKLKILTHLNPIIVAKSIINTTLMFILQLLN